MTCSDSSSDTTVPRLALATLVAFMFAGAATLISANNPNPNVVNSDTALRVPVETTPFKADHALTSALQTINEQRQARAVLQADEQAFAKAALAFSDQTVVASNPTGAEQAFTKTSAETEAAPVATKQPIDSRSERSIAKQAHVSLARRVNDSGFRKVAFVTAPVVRNRAALRSNRQNRDALSNLQDQRAYYPTESEYKDAAVTINKKLESQQLEINVNTFLMSQHVSNESRLAELQMQPFFAEFDRPSFIKTKDTQPEQVAYAGVGFPHIESNNRSAKHRYKPYKQLVSFSGDANANVVPNVKCMGLSAERVAKRAEQYESIIFDLSIEHDVSASLIKAVIAKESCFNPKARSHVGAIGLMQLMPDTADWLNVKHPENPKQNLSAGVRYLKLQRERFGSTELALAAYNAGPGNVVRYKGIPPFSETQNYVVDVMHFYRGYQATTHYVNALEIYQEP